MKQLEKALGVQRSRDLVNQYRKIRSNNPTLKTANILVLNKGFTPNKGFVQFLSDGFGSQVSEYDLVNSKGRAVGEVGGDK